MREVDRENHGRSPKQSVWQQHVFQNLIAAREACSNAAERMASSKRIREFYAIRFVQNGTEDYRYFGTFSIFFKLILTFDPIRMGRKQVRTSADTFTGTYRGQGIPPFCLEELHCLTGMRANKGGDGEEFVLEMLRFGSCGLHQRRFVFSTTCCSHEPLTRIGSTQCSTCFQKMGPSLLMLTTGGLWRPYELHRITIKKK